MPNILNPDLDHRRFFVQRNNYDFDYDLYIRAMATGANVTNMRFEKTEPGQFCPPAMRLRQEEMQQLFDELWKAGFRSSEYVNKESALDATKYHLEDMRQLVFTKYDHQPS